MNMPSRVAGSARLGLAHRPRRNCVTEWGRGRSCAPVAEGSIALIPRAFPKNTVPQFRRGLPLDEILFAKNRSVCYTFLLSESNPASCGWFSMRSGNAFETGCVWRDETFCTQPETRADFFYFFARNPLKSPDSDE
jgi:hypothetical protein